MGESSKRREEAASRSPNRATLTLRQIHPIAFGGGNMRLSRTAVLRKLQLLRNCKTILATYLKRPLHLRSLPLASGKHPRPFSRGLRANRHCSQRSGDRLTTSKQTAATKRSIVGSIGRANPEISRFYWASPLKVGAKTKAPSPRRRLRQLLVPPSLAATPGSPTSVRPRPPTSESNPTKTKRFQKSNAASSQTGVRPPPPLRSLTPTHLMNP